MAIIRIPFFMVGPNAGRTGSWAQKAFNKGVWIFQGEPKDLGSIAHMLSSYYSAFTYYEALNRAPQYFEEGGCYYGHHEIPRDSNLSPRRERTAPNSTDDGERHVEPNAVPEWSSTQVGGGFERPEGYRPGDSDNENPSLPTSTVDDILGLNETSEEPTRPTDESSTDIVPLETAIADLDPEDDDQWTANGVPALQYLSDQTGEQISRAQVTIVAPGLTRGRLRALKREEG